MTFLSGLARFVFQCKNKKEKSGPFRVDSVVSLDQKHAAIVTHQVKPPLLFIHWFKCDLLYLIGLVLRCASIYPNGPK